MYWLVSYPNVDANGAAVWGPSVKPDDDLWLQYSIWGTAKEGATPRQADVTRTVTMRNEISAMANKIFPNGANKVPQEYQDLLQMYTPSWTNTADDGTPGTFIETEGIWYDLGNIGAGFDNNGDLVPDRNAWLQPVGDADLFDPSCFRLVHTYAMVIVKLNDGTEVVYNVENQLYFENVPENNRGAVGYVRYEFMSMRGGCSSTLTPYQEVASGDDNEKFNGDYGATLGRGLTSGTSRVEIVKSASPAVTVAGSNVAYTVAFTNSGAVSVGHPELFMPLVVQDSIPTGTLYVAGSATNNNTLPAGVTNYAVYYSTNSGTTWTTNEPSPATNVTRVQWWLSDALAPAAAGVVRFSVTVKSPHTNSNPQVLNTAGLSLGNALPFLTSQASTLVAGINKLGDTVWRDDGTGAGGLLGNQLQDGAEAGITGVTIRLYYDLNTNGVIDTGDFFLSATNTGVSGLYSFTNLPDGYYIVQVESTNANIPAGFTPTTTTNWWINLDAARTNGSAVTNLTADFGFAPALTLNKTLTSTNAFREGQTVTYQISVTNRLPGDGTGAGTLATYYAWATNGVQSGTEWFTHTNAYIPPGPDGLYASNNFKAASKTFILSAFPMSVQNGSISNVSVVMPIVVVPLLSNPDTFDVTVDRLSPAQRIFTGNYMTTNLVSGTLTIPMTGTFAWAWADFATNYTVTLTCAKGGASGGSIWLLLDAVGFKIQSTVTTGVASATTTLNPVPLTDRYDADQFQFVSANPATTSVTTNGSPPNSVGSLVWSNVGPIYPGGTSTVAVTFKLLKPDNYTNQIVTNITWVTNALFTSGRPANTATSSVVTTQMPAGTIGDYVWRDLNGDGVQNETNMGIANVAVSITPPPTIDLGNGAGVAITNYTDATGYYKFESIPTTGVYTVRVVTVTLPSGTNSVNTYDEDGGTNSTTAVYINIYTNGTNNIHLTADFGYRVQSSIVGTIWDDWNRGGETNRQAGEEWLTNVTVYLCTNPSPCGAGTALATNTTDTNGFFRFNGNYTGTYTVAVATNTGMMSNGTWRLSFDTDGTNTANYSSVAVVSGGVARADFSYYRTGSYAIGDTLYYDWDGNGVQSNAFEEGISNITVYLYNDANGNGVVDTNTDAFIALTVTTTNGYYAFTNLFATNTYLVYFDRNDPDLPPSCFITADPYGAKDGRSVVTLTNASRLDQDFGLQPYGNGSIGDTVWKDMNADGTQTGTQETGITNILVSLYVDMNNDGTYVLLRTTNTATSGTYLFGSLPAGKYRVVVDSASTNLPVDVFSNRYYASTATSHDVTISGGNTVLTADFGFAPYGAIGDTIFWDSNNNGTQDYSEDGVSGVVVRLYYDANTNGVYDAGETLVTSATTDVSGLYLFAGLLPTNYAVMVVTTNGPLLNVSQSADPNSDGYACDDTNNVVPCDDQYGLRLSGGQNFMGADFGYLPPGVIGDLLWVDSNDNGIQDAGESGIPYISVVLYSNGVAIATNETDADGYYYFSGLADGTFGVRAATNDVDFPAGLINTWTADGTFDNYTTNIVISGGVVTSVGGYPCTGCDLSIDFGYRYAGDNSLSGTIGFDATPYDGVLNGTNTSGVATNESPYANVQVYLYLWNDDGDGIVESGEYVAIASTATATNGDYSFTGLPNGDGNDKYIVSSSAPEDYLRLTTTNGSIAGVTVIAATNAMGNTISAYLTVNVAANVKGMDFAYRSTKSYDYGDLPDLYQTTLPDGARHLVSVLTNLYLGSTVDTENNGQPSAGADGDDLTGADDEDGVIQITNAIWRIGTTGGSVRVTVGKGAGWLVGYIDFNGDGDFMDVDEMVVNMVASNTGGNGAGVYTNAFTIPAGTFSSTSSTPLVARFRLFPSEPFIPELAFSGTADNGEVEDYLWHLAGIGNYVWIDQNGDGVQDAGEPPITGVRVFIDLNADGLYQANEPSSTTDGDGLYGIGGLVPGTYTVAVDTNTLLLGITQTYDLDGIGTANKASVTVTNLNQFVDTADFGYRGDVTIGDRAWYDGNRNGIQDGGETNGISGVPVALLDADSNVVATTTTDASGYYFFSNMPPDTYRVQFDLSTVAASVEVSPADQGGDEALDSDATSGGTGGFAYTATFAMAGGQTNLNIDMGLRQQSTTRAEVAEVWGEWTDGKGRVAWRTSSEWNTAGFFVYRVDPETGVETRLNDTLLPSEFDGTGAVYELEDLEVLEGAEGTYRLEEVELSGGMMDLGAHDIRFAAPPPVAKAARAEVRAAKAAAPVLMAATKAEGPSSRLKVLVKKEGIFGVSLQSIADGMGLALEAVQALAGEGSLKITAQGVPVPSIYDAARGRLVFHGRGTRNWYTRDAAYMISIDTGLAMLRREPGAGSGEATLPVAVHFEQDRYPFDTATEMPDDFYYWNYVISGNATTGQRSFPLDLTGGTGDVALKVRLMGWSSTTNDPDHLAEFRFNGAVVGSTTFDGQDVQEVDLAIPGSAVSNGMNALVVKGVLQPGRSFSYFVVDWIEASFERQLVPMADTAHFRAGAAVSISVAAFAEPLALALDEAGNPTWIANADGALPDKTWAVAAENERFAVIEADGVPLLAPEPAAADAWFLSETNRIDYLVIASRALEAAAQELADYRAGQGLRVGVATFEDICDLMTDGLRTPEAIPELLSYAQFGWAESPWMVVLAGNGHYDYLGALSNEVNHLPPMMIQTRDGLFSADGRLADTGGDTLPDIAIGRLPARTPAELTAMIAKVKAYEAEFGTAWQSQLVLAADTADSAAGNFAESNTKLENLATVPHGVPARIDLDTTAIASARTSLSNWFKAGAGFIHYTGHGGVNNWSAKNLLKATDVNVMANVREPVVVALSCLVGRFEAPAVDCLGELLLRRAQGGAVAVWGPSGLSRNAPATELGEAFYRAILQEGAGTLGLAILQARRGLQGDLFTKDTFAVYNLLGDPALRIAGNTGGQPSDANFAQWRWQRFAPVELTDTIISGSTEVNFHEYAMNGGCPVEVELPEFGYPLVVSRSPDDQGFILRWKRRVQRSDIDYLLYLSENLEQWIEEPSELESVGVEADADGMMETVRTRVNRPDSKRIFIGIKAKRK